MRACVRVDKLRHFLKTYNSIIPKILNAQIVQILKSNSQLESIKIILFQNIIILILCTETIKGRNFQIEIAFFFFFTLNNWSNSNKKKSIIGGTPWK